jgi:monoamine oxidase
MPASRLEFILGSGATLGRSLFPRPLARRPAVPRIVVIGAGNAGMTAAYRIHVRSGWPVAVFEADTRVGGRTWTNRTFMNGGQWFEHGAGGVNTNQLAQPGGIGMLVKELQMGPMYDLWINYPNGGTERYFNGRRGFDDAAFATAMRVARKQFAQCRWPFTYANYNANNLMFDRMTVAEWIERYVPGGLRGSAGADIAAVWSGCLYGARAEDMSAFGIVAEFGGTFWKYPESTYDERWGIPGGNDNLSHELAARLPPGSVHLGYALIAIRRNAFGSVTLTFDADGRAIDVVADRVVIAMPTGAMLRVDYSRAGFDALKVATFQEPNGENCKLAFQFADQVWADNGQSGDAETDTVVSESWQLSYINTGGRYGGRNFAPPVWVAFNTQPYPHLPAHGPAPAQLVAQYLAVADALYPNPKASRRFAGKAWLDNWPQDPFARGSYSYYRPGQWQRIAGAEALPSGAIFFAGEHTAPYQERGYMNGAVLSGERAAREVLSSL